MHLPGVVQPHFLNFPESEDAEEMFPTPAAFREPTPGDQPQGEIEQFQRVMKSSFADIVFGDTKPGDGARDEVRTGVQKRMRASFRNIVWGV